MSFTIRQATSGDGAAVAAIYAPFVSNTAITFEEQPLDARGMAERIEKGLARYPFLVAELAGEVGGYAYASEHRARASYRWAVDVSVYIDPRFHRRGIGRGLYDVLLPLLVRQGFVLAVAGITVPNAASVGLHEAMGFSLVGVYRNVGYKLGEWRDVGWWQRALRDAPQRPGEPVLWGEMAGRFNDPVNTTK